MIRVHIICEGQTEESFVSDVLVPHFSQKGIALYPSLIGKPGHNDKSSTPSPSNKSRSTSTTV